MRIKNSSDLFRPGWGMSFLMVKSRAPRGEGWGGAQVIRKLSDLSPFLCEHAQSVLKVL